MSKLIIDGDPCAIENLLDELQRRNYLGSDFVFHVIREDETVTDDVLMEDLNRLKHAADRGNKDGIYHYCTEIYVHVGWLLSEMSRLMDRVAELEAPVVFSESPSRNGEKGERDDGND